MFEIWGTSASTYSGDVEGYFVKVSGKFAPAWTDPLTSDEKVGIMGKSGGLFYPICDVDIGGHTSPTIPINGIIIKSGGVFKPKITLP